MRNVAMKQMKISIVFLLALFVSTLAWGGGRQGFDQNYGGKGMMNGRYQGGQGRREARGYPGGMDQGSNGLQGQNGRQSYGTQSDRKYRSNLYNDDDVYGYDATYPNGEAAYINYRSKDARARRGPEFARTSRAYSRQGGNGERGNNNFGQMNEYRGGGGNGGNMW